MFSKKSLEHSVSDVSNNKVNTSSQKDLNNNTINTSQKSTKTKIEYKLIDEMNEDSVLKEKRLKICFEDKDIYLYLLWFDRKQLIHSSQVLEMTNYSEISFNRTLRDPEFQAGKDIYVTRFLNIPKNKSIFDWVQNTLGINLDEQNETYFIVYENLSKFSKLICSPSDHKKIIEALESKNSKNQSPQYFTSTELNYNINYLNKTTDRLKQRCSTFDQDSIQFKQINALIKKYTNLRDDYLSILENLYQ